MEISEPYLKHWQIVQASAVHIQPCPGAGRVYYKYVYRYDPRCKSKTHSEMVTSLIKIRMEYMYIFSFLPQYWVIIMLLI